VKPQSVLDLGAGTAHGSRALKRRFPKSLVVAADIAPGMLERAKLQSRWLRRFERVRADAYALPFRDGSFDLVFSSLMLQWCDDLDVVFAEIARVLRPGGRVLLEVEHRWSLDLLWRLASSAVGDPLGYEVTASAAARALAWPLSSGVWIDYPGYPALRLFTRPEIDQWLGDAGLVPRRAWGLHSATNLLPSTVLHRPRLGRVAGALYRGLCALDRTLAATGPGRAFANSLVILAEKPTRLPGTVGRPRRQDTR
jgi:SAM-dependent methyltransferase